MDANELIRKNDKMQNGHLSEDNRGKIFENVFFLFSFLIAFWLLTTSKCINHCLILYLFPVVPLPFAYSLTLSQSIFLYALFIFISFSIIHTSHTPALHISRCPSLSLSLFLQTIYIHTLGLSYFFHVSLFFYFLLYFYFALYIENMSLVHQWTNLGHTHATLS